MKQFLSINVMMTQSSFCHESRLATWLSYNCLCSSIANFCYCKTLEEEELEGYHVFCVWEFFKWVNSRQFLSSKCMHHSNRSLRLVKKYTSQKQVGALWLFGIFHLMQYLIIYSWSPTHAYNVQYPCVQ